MILLPVFPNLKLTAATKTWQCAFFPKASKSNLATKKICLRWQNIEKWKIQREGQYGTSRSGDSQQLINLRSRVWNQMNFEQAFEWLEKMMHFLQGSTNKKVLYPTHFSGSLSWQAKFQLENVKRLHIFQLTSLGVSSAGRNRPM